MALRQCLVCKEYFPEPDVKIKTGGYRHDNCVLFAAETSLERHMRAEMIRFKESAPLFYAMLEHEKSTNVPIKKG